MFSVGSTPVDSKGCQPGGQSQTRVIKDGASAQAGRVMTRAALPVRSGLCVRMSSRGWPKTSGTQNLGVSVRRPQQRRFAGGFQTVTPQERGNDSPG